MLAAVTTTHAGNKPRLVVAQEVAASMLDFAYPACTQDWPTLVRLRVLVSENSPRIAPNTGGVFTSAPERRRLKA